MDIADKLLSLRIIKQHLYFDKKSLEEWTNTVKPKYKLAGNEILSQYFFNILTKDSSTCKTKCTLMIEQKDWENQVSGPYLTEKQSFCDLSKFEILGKKELVQKIRDGNNGFPYIARLRDAKYEELQSLKESIRAHDRVPEEEKVRIPLIPDADSGARRTAVPEDSGRLFRAIPDSPSGWGDAGDVRFFA